MVAIKIIICNHYSVFKVGNMECVYVIRSFLFTIYFPVNKRTHSYILNYESEMDEIVAYQLCLSVI